MQLDKHPSASPSPLWWQRLFPRYGNWGAPGWSAGAWNNDPEATDWTVPAIDAMDAAFKRHDWRYQHGRDMVLADVRLLRDLQYVEPPTRYGRLYRRAARLVFAAHIAFRLIQRGIS